MEVGYLIGFLTHPFIALLYSSLLFIGGLCIYGESANKKNAQYSKYLYEYVHGGAANIVINGFMATGIASFFGSVVMGLVILETGKPDLGIGIYAYGISLMCSLIFFTGAERAERKDIKGQHKQAIKRIMSQAEVQKSELQNYAKYEGKSALKVQRLNSSLQKVITEAKSEKRIRKNKENVYRSLERLLESENRLKKVAESVVGFQLEIENLYDRLYEFEAMLVNKRYEEERKKLNIAKEQLNVDPYAAVHLFNSFQYMYTLPEGSVEKAN